MKRTPKVFIYRPHDEPRDVGAIAYTADGDMIGGHVSSSLEWAKRDMAQWVPAGAAVEWVIGREAMQAKIDAGEITGVHFGESDHRPVEDARKSSRESLADSFASYRARAMPANPAENQVLECRRAFMAGALSSVTNAIAELDATGNVREELTAQLVELRTFLGSVVGGGA